MIVLSEVELQSRRGLRRSQQRPWFLQEQHRATWAFWMQMVASERRIMATIGPNDNSEPFGRAQSRILWQQHMTFAQRHRLLQTPLP